MVMVWCAADGSVVASAAFPLDLSPQDRQAQIAALSAQWPGTAAVTVAPKDLPQGPRAQWRKHPTEARLVLDTTVPVPLSPRQALLNDIAAAQTINDLKAILTRMV